MEICVGVMVGADVWLEFEPALIAVAVEPGDRTPDTEFEGGAGWRALDDGVRDERFREDNGPAPRFWFEGDLFDRGS